MRRALLLLLAACGSDDPDEPVADVCGDGITGAVESCDDGNRTGGDGCDAACHVEQALRVTWGFYPMLGGPPQLDCRAGVAALEVVTEANTTRRFPCDDTRTAMMFAQPLDRVLVRLRAANDDVLAESVPRLAVDGRVDAPFYEDAGFLRFTLAHCDHPDVTLTITPTGGTAFGQIVRCRDADDADDTMYSAPIRAGVYDVTVASEMVLQQHANVVVGANNAITELTAP